MPSQTLFPLVSHAHSPTRHTKYTLFNENLLELMLLLKWSVLQFSNCHSFIVFFSTYEHFILQLFFFSKFDHLQCNLWSGWSSQQGQCDLAQRWHSLVFFYCLLLKASGWLGFLWTVPGDVRNKNRKQIQWQQNIKDNRINNKHYSLKYYTTGGS